MLPLFVLFYTFMCSWILAVHSPPTFYEKALYTFLWLLLVLRLVVLSIGDFFIHKFAIPYAVILLSVHLSLKIIRLLLGYIKLCHLFEICHRLESLCEITSALIANLTAAWVIVSGRLVSFVFIGNPVRHYSISLSGLLWEPEWIRQMQWTRPGYVEMLLLMGFAFYILGILYPLVTYARRVKFPWP